jgi:hypothetical protein
MIKITSRGLEISNPTSQELASLENIQEAVKLAERDRIWAEVALCDWVGDQLSDDLLGLLKIIKGENK